MFALILRLVWADCQRIYILENHVSPGQQRLRIDEIFSPACNNNERTCLPTQCSLESRVSLLNTIPVESDWSHLIQFFPSKSSSCVTFPDEFYGRFFPAWEMERWKTCFVFWGAFRPGTHSFYFSTRKRRYQTLCRAFFSHWKRFNAMLISLRNSFTLLFYLFFLQGCTLPRVIHLCTKSS